MYAIFHRDSKVLGYKQITQGEEKAFMLPYVIVEKLPQEVDGLKDGYFAKYDGQTFTVEKMPGPVEPEKTPDQLEIEQLKQGAADLNLQIIDIWETLIAGGVA